jgi:two-component system, chemotaxis family, protein-glutamate methylesterase/glutaminase
VVIGGSAGAFDSLRSIVRGLPGNFPGSIFVVLHLFADFSSTLHLQISRWGHLPARQPIDGDPVAQGRIYIARPDHHMTLEGGRIRMMKGPRENRHRPAIDPLFRTAAREYGPRVMGVVLSGLFDDGSAGLFAVKERGGVAIVQDPEDAERGEMPRHAIEYARPQYVLKTEDIASHLVTLATSDMVETDMATKRSAKASGKGNGSESSSEPRENLKASYSEEGEGMPSVFACPECHGVLWELKDQEIIRFRCRVGHSYGPQSLTKEMSAASESALWAAMRALEEKAALQRRVADGMTSNKTSVKRLRDQSAADDGNARLIRNMIFKRDEKLEKQQETEDPAKKTA